MSRRYAKPSRGAVAKELAKELLKDPIFDLSKPITSLTQKEFEALRHVNRSAHFGKRWPSTPNYS